MNILNIVAHAGVEHSNEAEAASHQSGSTTLIIVITSVTLIVIAVAVRFLGREEKPQTPKKQEKPKK